MPETEQRWGAAAEKNSARFEIIGHQLHFPDQRGNVAVDDLAGGGFREKGAVRAFLGAERHVNVEALRLDA